MNIALFTLALALVWAAVTGTFTLLNLLLGAAIALIAVFFLRERMASPIYVRRLLRFGSLALLFLRELFVSAFRVAALVLSPRLGTRLQPGIVAFPLSVTSDVEITLLANLITLTPGTLSVDVSEDRSTLYVHVLALPDKQALIAEIASGFEAKVKEVFA